MRGGRCWAETFSAETITEEGGGDADEGCGFYEDFAAVEEVGVAVFEGSVRMLWRNRSAAAGNTR
jgi:hypothetical protein